MSQFLIQCPYSWAGEPPSNAPTSKEEALAYIDRLYETGAPLFTKDAIRAIYEQIQRNPKRDKIFGKDLTGGDLEYKVEIDRKETVPDKDNVPIVRTCVKPVLLYRCRAHIKNELCRFGFEEDKPNLTSLVLYHDTEGRREDTKELFRPFPVPPHETVAEGLREQIHLWRQSEMWSRLLQALDTSAAKHEITKVIGLALGNLWLAGETARHSRQHALLLTLRQWLLQHKENFPCYVQDLVYNSTDASILEEHGVEIIEGPRAWLEIDDNTDGGFGCA